MIGAGFGRTGTMSLKRALNALGLRTYHMDEVVRNPSHGRAWEALATAELGRDAAAAAAAAADDDWQTRTGRYDVLKRIAQDGYTATTDFPACLLFEEQMALWPDAKVILTARRSGQKWKRSVARTIGRTGYIVHRPPFSFIASPLMPFPMGGFNDWIWRTAGVQSNADHSLVVDSLAAAHNRWFEKVVAAVPRENLLVFYPGDGWNPLCTFLEVDDCPIDAPFPRAWNTSAVFGRILDFAELITHCWWLVLAVLCWWALRCLRARCSNRQKVKAI